VIAGHIHLNRSANVGGEEQGVTQGQPLYNEQLNDVREEAMVLALERYLLPGHKSSGRDAYVSALKKICTTTTKGWFREFAIDHYPELRDCPPERDLLAITRSLKRTAKVSYDSTFLQVHEFNDNNVMITVLFNNYPHIVQPSLITTFLPVDLSVLVASFLPSRKFVIHKIHNLNDDSDCHAWAESWIPSR